MKKSSREKERKKVVWDEENLDFNEANKSPKRKIDEPKTPFHQLSIDSDTGEAFSPFHSQSGSDSEPFLNPELVREALSHVATTSLGSGSEGGSEGGSEKGSEKSTETVAKRKAGWTSSEDEASDWEGSGDRRLKSQVSFIDEEPNKGLKDPTGQKKFNEKRKRHYDEYLKAKELLGSGDLSAESDFEDNPETNSREGAGESSSMEIDKEVNGFGGFRGDRSPSREGNGT